MKTLHRDNSNNCFVLVFDQSGDLRWCTDVHPLK